MKKIILLSSLMFFFSCASESDAPGPDINEYSNEIRLGGVLSYVSEGTRGEGPIKGTKPSSDLSLNIFRCDAIEGSTVFPDEYTDAFTGTMAATTGEITMDPAQFYHTDPTLYTKLIALYPAGGIYDATNRWVTYSALDGSTDYMFSGFVMGSRTSPVGSMTFKHILTQIHVKVVAATEDAIASWGNVTSITLDNQLMGEFTLLLPTPESIDEVCIQAIGGDPQRMPFTTATGAPASTSQALTTTATTYGYAICLPPGANPLTFNISTTKAEDLTLTTASQAFEAGKAYEMTIKFTLSSISITATLTDWVAGDSITGEL